MFFIDTHRVKAKLTKKMNRFLSTMSSFAIAQSTTATVTLQTTIATATGIISHDQGIEGNFTGYSSGNGVEIEQTFNWMAEYEKFFNDENNFDYQGFLNSLKTDEQADFMNYISSSVVLEWYKIETNPTFLEHIEHVINNSQYLDYNHAC